MPHRQTAAAAQGGAVRPQGSLAERAYERLEEMIITLELEPGALLREAEICARLGIGRTPVREALKHLERDGLVEIQARRGIWVTPIDVRSELLALEVRRPLERLVCGRAARRRSEQEAAAFARLAAEFRATGDRSDRLSFMRLDHEFNERVLAAGRNPFAEEAIGAFQARSRRFWFSQVTTGRDLVRAATLHADVSQAIAAGDEGAAGAASDRLLADVEAFVRASFAADL
jgi:DNA-binding GntR family transcriptional regulator